MWVYKANDTDKFPAGGSSFAQLHDVREVQVERHRVRPHLLELGRRRPSRRAPPGRMDRVGVYVKFRHNAFTHLVFNSITIEESTVMRFEPKPTTQGCQS